MRESRDKIRVDGYAVFRAWKKALEQAKASGLEAVLVSDLEEIEAKERERLGQRKGRPSDLEVAYNVLVRIGADKIETTEVARLAQVAECQARRVVARAKEAGFLEPNARGGKSNYRLVKRLPGTYAQFKEITAKHKPKAERG